MAVKCNIKRTYQPEWMTQKSAATELAVAALSD